MDAAKVGDDATDRLRKMTVLFIDEVSMIDDYTWPAIRDQLTTIAASNRHDMLDGKPPPPADDYGGVHLVLFGDLKQLPPATSRPPFLAASMQLFADFSFRVLRQNRRVALDGATDRQAELENFHEVLEDIAHGRTTHRVQQFLLDAYVRGACTDQASVAFEGSTACFPKRRYRDRWNKKV